LLEALGPPPNAEAGTEPEDIATERHNLTERLLDYQAQVALSELTATQADALDQSILLSNRKDALERLLTQYPMPLAPTTLTEAGVDSLRALTKAGRTHAEWFQALWQGPEQNWIWPVLMVLIAALVSWSLRYVILLHFGRDGHLPDPSYPRRFGAAVAEGLARGAFPGLVLLLIITLVERTDTLADNPLRDLYIGLLWSLTLFVLIAALSRAVLAPDLPAWRLPKLPPETARTLNHRIIILAAILAVDRWLVHGFETLGGTPAMVSVLATAIATAEALAVLALTPVYLWRNKTTTPQEKLSNHDDGEASRRKIKHPFLHFLRRAVAVMAFLSVGAALLGYLQVAEYLLHNPLFTALIFGVLVLVRELLREFLDALLRVPSFRDGIGLQHEDTFNLSRFWLRGVLNLGLFGIGVFLAFPLWVRGFVPFTDVLHWGRQVLTELTIGNITISITEIAAALAALSGAVIATRLLQRLLLQKVLPQTRLSTSSQYSITAGVGFIGMTLAVILGIAMLGVDVANLALIAGALSVGIGFGLQNVVNNFISGLILLFERPIKVGDWVVMNDNEGIIRRISIRATELETFQKASVLIPNADLLANAVVNLTHHDHFGRVDVRVGTDYEADMEQVRDILLECAREHPLILKRHPTLRAHVLFQEFGRFRLEMELRCYTANVNERIFIASDLRFAIEQRFRKAGIEIPLPQEVVHFTELPRQSGIILGKGEGQLIEGPFSANTLSQPSR
jgi:small-conductance mechanosensitive channel